MTKSLLALNCSYSVSIEGISSRHGPHQVAHKLRKITLPLSEASETVCPLNASSRLNALAISPAGTGALALVSFSAELSDVVLESTAICGWLISQDAANSSSAASTRHAPNAAR